MPPRPPPPVVVDVRCEGRLHTILLQEDGRLTLRHHHPWQSAVVRAAIGAPCRCGAVILAWRDRIQNMPGGSTSAWVAAKKTLPSGLLGEADKATELRRRRQMWDPEEVPMTKRLAQRIIELAREAWTRTYYRVREVSVSVLNQGITPTGMESQDPNCRWGSATAYKGPIGTPPEMNAWATLVLPPRWLSIWLHEAAVVGGTFVVDALDDAAMDTLRHARGDCGVRVRAIRQLAGFAIDLRRAILRRRSGDWTLHWVWG